MMILPELGPDAVEIEFHWGAGLGGSAEYVAVAGCLRAQP